MERSRITHLKTILTCSVALGMLRCTPKQSPVTFPSDFDAFAETSTQPQREAPIPKSRDLSMSRSKLDAILAEGLGVFLSSISVEAVIEERRFKGWKMVETPRSPLDIRADDVIRSVNGSPIETPNMAHATWTSLSTLDLISIDIVRQGTPIIITIHVEEDRNGDAS